MWTSPSNIYFKKSLNLTQQVLHANENLFIKWNEIFINVEKNINL